MDLRKGIAAGSDSIAVFVDAAQLARTEQHRIVRRMGLVRRQQSVADSSAVAEAAGSSAAAVAAVDST